MHVCVVAYTPDALSRDLAHRIAQRFSVEPSEVSCRRYEGVLGRWRERRDVSRGTLPEIEVAPPVGPVDALIVGAPLVAGRLAPPMLSFLEKPHRVPPVLGVFATCTKRYPALGFEADLDRLANAFDGPEGLILSQWDVDAAGTKEPRALSAFYDRLAPLVDVQLTPAIIPVRAA